MGFSDLSSCSSSYALRVVPSLSCGHFDHQEAAFASFKRSLHGA
jgi:hypothetical protein